MGAPFQVASLSADIDDLLPAVEVCVLCAAQCEAESEAISKTAKSIAEDVQRVDSPTAICLPHLRLLLAAIEDFEPDP